MRIRPVCICLSSALLAGSFAFYGFRNNSQKTDFPSSVKNTHLAKMKENDSVCYYQCYCALNTNPPQFISKDSVAAKNIRPGLITVTEKFSLKKQGNAYRLRFYTSNLSDYPNKKFAYLKLTEKAYWGFALKRDTLLSYESVLRLAALELKLRPLTEYNFKVERDNYPQVIMNGKKLSEQRMVEGNYLIHEFLPELK